MARNTFKDSWTFDEAIKSLNSNTSFSSSLTYKLLSSIRKELDWPQHKENIIKLQKSGCLKQLVAYLHSSNLHIVSVTLSILGNCCMDNKSSNDIIFSNGLSEFNQLLKKYPKEDSVHGRIFRIIGNMCQHSMGNIILEMKPQLIGYIVQFLQKYADDEDKTFTEATIVMAIRALRQLLNSHTFFSMVKKFGVLKGIGTLLIKSTKRWIEEKKDQHILDNIIKLLLQYSKYRYYPGIVELRNTPKGDSLIYLSKLLVLAPKKIVRIIMNLVKVSQLKSDLPIPEICSSFIDLLKDKPVAEDFNEDYRNYIRCLCFLLEHPANRNSERCKETIPQLIRLLREFTNPTKDMLESCLLIVVALDKCHFHDQLMKEQLENSAIEVLAEKIEWIVGSTKPLITKHRIQIRKKRKSRFFNDVPLSKKSIGISYPDLFEPKSPCSSDGEDDDFSFAGPSVLSTYRCSSPSSGSDSELFLSPWSSPGASPSSMRHKGYPTILPYPDYSDSEDYSPVCSDFEDEEAQSIKGVNEEIEGNFEIARISDGEDDKSEEINSISDLTLKQRLLYQILVLLKTYFITQVAPIKMCYETLIMALIKCSISFEHNNLIIDSALKLLSRILEVHEYLIPLIQSNVIHNVFSLLKTPHSIIQCDDCERIEKTGRKLLSMLSNLAESGRAKGDIANRLILGSDDLKKKLVLHIPYIIKNKETLNSLMLKCGGLDILMELLLDLRFQEKSIHVLCTLSSNNLRINNPQQWAGSHGEKMVVDDYKIPENCKNVVTFVLDDNSCLNADRDFLSAKSSFFNSLLNGGFRESNEQFVKLHQTNYKALKSLINILHAEFDKTEPKDIQLDTQTLLEVIMLSDRYLLEDLCSFLTESVQQYSMKASSVPIIYKWSLESKTNILRVESVAYALVGISNDSERFLLFKNLFNLGYCQEILTDIKTLITRYFLM